MALVERGVQDSGGDHGRLAKSPRSSAAATPSDLVRPLPAAHLGRDDVRAGGRHVQRLDPETEQNGAGKERAPRAAPMRKPRGDEQPERGVGHGDDEVREDLDAGHADRAAAPSAGTRKYAVIATSRRSVARAVGRGAAPRLSLQTSLCVTIRARRKLRVT